MTELTANQRFQILQYVLLGLALIVGLRLAYLQIVKHNHYTALAASEHQRKYEVPAPRGQIYVRDGDAKVPLALNQDLKLLYADPSLIQDKVGTAAKLAAVTGDNPQDYQKALQNGKEYAMLKPKVDDAMATKIKELNLKGVGLVSQSYRTYPEGTLAAQLLGFVNNDGKGQYGIEGYLDKELQGKPGLLNAKTDTAGVPIATSDNLSKAPENGTSMTLTIDRSIQAQSERFIKEGVEAVRADSGSVIVMDPNTGAIKAMANYPTYDPNEYAKTKDYQRFQNQTVTNAFEPGSGFKTFTMAAGLDSGKVRPETTYNDPGCVKMDKYEICNADGHKGGPNTNMTVVLRDSLNTGVMFVLQSLGGDSSKMTSAAKQVFHSYITDRFQFGKRTGIEQAGEAKGVINPPTSNNVNYANMSFGQGESVTMVQMAAAMSAIANRGTYYQPYLVEERQNPDGTTVKTKPKVVKDEVVSRAAAEDLTSMLEVVVEHGSGYLAKTPGYKIAGKTGTAQVPNPTGAGYLPDVNIGTFTGFAPAENPQFVVMVRINHPRVPGFAEKTTVPVFSNLTRWLLQYYKVPPSS